MEFLSEHHCLANFASKSLLLAAAIFCRKGGILWAASDGQPRPRQTATADTLQDKHKNLLTKRIVRVALGAALVLGLFLGLDTEALWAVVVQAQVSWFLAALGLAVVANLVCAWRWKQIAADLGIHAGFGLWARRYFQGISVNSVLPGGIIGGDVWRASQFRPLAASAQAVLLDRVSGLWGLAWVSLACIPIALLIAIPAPDHVLVLPLFVWGGLYSLGLVLLALGPFVVAAIPFGPAHPVRAAAQSPILKKTLAVSVASQVLTILAFWACLLAVQGSVNLFWLAGLCTAIFLSAMLPASLGGFGARELGAVFFLGFIGLPAEKAFVASILFGLTATLQGAFALVFFFYGERPASAGQ